MDKHEQFLQKRRDYYKNNKEKIKSYYSKEKRTLWLKNNQARLSEYNRNYRKRYYEANKERIRSQVRSWSILNRVKINAHLKDKKRKNTEFMLSCKIRSKVANSIRGKDKFISAVRDLGCSVPELKLHLESQFKEGMTWANYGKWHIDHIKPLAKFDLSKVENQRLAFHYKNLQPLWALDNLVKGSKYEKDNKNNL